MEAAECGAASLAIVLGYHGRHAPLEALRVACDVSRDGTNALNVIRAAREYGLQAKGFRKNPDTLHQLPLPAIVHWNFNHFVVLEGAGRRGWYINDPAVGRYRVTAREFDEAFTGVVLAFEPGPDFVPAHETPGLLARLRPRLGRARGALTFVLLASLGLVIPGLAIPMFTTVFIDQVLVRGMRDWVVPLLLIMALVMAINAGLTWLQQRYLLRLATKLSVSSSSAFLWHVLRLPIEFFHNRSPGEIGSRVELNDRVAALLSGELATTLLSVLTLGFYLALMLMYDPVLTAVTAALAALNAVALILVSRRRRDGSRRLLQDEGKLMGTTMSGLGMIETLKASAAESDFFAKWSGQFAKALNAKQELGSQTLLLTSVPPLLQALNVAAVLTLGSLRVMDGELTIGMLIAFQYLMANFLGPVHHLVNAGSLLQEAEGDLTRLDDVLHCPPAPLDPAGTGHPDDGTVKLRGALELRDVTFGYSRRAPPLLEHFSLSLAPGAWVALVGGSGCGKSTIARLIAGLYQPWEGDVLLDGVSRSRVPRRVICHSLAMVEQDVVLFHDSVAANLSLWDRSVPREHLERAARDAEVHDVILARRGGYDGVLSEGGRDTSGGQRQRLEIARALAANPSLLILDEATSALDPVTEQRVMANLRRRGCACVVVAHRLSTIRDCDEIIVLDRGRVVERGTHRALLAAAGPYARLIAAA
jgi:NHLM bacteriocin system ABC transporter peptidase/ATP-binding protein